MSRFPLYELYVNGGHQFCPLHEAAVLYDSGMLQVSLGKTVILEDGTTRPLNNEDSRTISDAAERYSESK